MEKEIASLLQHTLQPDDHVVLNIILLVDARVGIRDYSKTLHIKNIKIFAQGGLSVEEEIMNAVDKFVFTQITPDEESRRKIAPFLYEDAMKNFNVTQIELNAYDCRVVYSIDKGKLVAEQIIFDLKK